jgi:beta-glucosidase
VKAVNGQTPASRFRGSDAIPYSEGIFIGYRGYEHNHMEPLFPFGFGLSYTPFAYSDIDVEPAVFNGTAPIKVTFTVTNTGKRRERKLLSSTWASKTL